MLVRLWSCLEPPEFRQALDKETGLSDFGHRWYDAAVGRLLSEDPFGYFAGDMNLYRYVFNDPFNNTDPSGLCSKSVNNWWNTSLTTSTNYRPVSISGTGQDPTWFQTAAGYSSIASYMLSSAGNSIGNTLRSTPSQSISDSIGKNIVAGITEGAFATASFGAATTSRLLSGNPQEAVGGFVGFSAGVFRDSSLISTATSAESFIINSSATLAGYGSNSRAIFKESYAQANPGSFTALAYNLDRFGNAISPIDYSSGRVASPFVETAALVTASAANKVAGIVARNSNLATIMAEREGIILSASNTGTTFWSGGTPARTAAEAWASSSGSTTLEMTAAGQNLTRVTQGMSWQQARPLWITESRNLAANASGEIHVFQNAAGMATNSIWATVEYPTLMSNPNVTGIVKHVVMPNGTVVIVP